jgi:hypothetical protein
VKFKPTKQLKHSDEAGVTQEPAYEMPFLRHHEAARISDAA